MKLRAPHLRLLATVLCPCCHCMPFDGNPFVTSPLHGIRLCHQCNELQVQEVIRCA